MSMVNTVWWYAYRGRDICMHTTIIPRGKECILANCCVYYA
jgi:hypothetical protein